MMKRNAGRIVPLAVKIWLIFASMVAVCLILVYLFTIVFLEQDYVYEKKNQVVDITGQAVFHLLEQPEYNKMIAMEDAYLDELAMRNNLCIDLLSANGHEIMAFDGIGAGCYLHSSMNVRMRMYLAAMENPSQYVINEVRHPQFGTSYYICTRFFSHPQTGVSYVLMVCAPLASVSEAADAIRGQLSTITLVLFAVATVVSMLLAFWLTRPMKKISEAAKAVAAGHLDTVVTIRSRDELGVCADNFNEMVTQIRSSNKLQREMVANVSHDLRTPLTMIRGYAESIRDIVGEDKEQRERQLDIIIDETDRLGKLVTDIMELSLLQAGKLKLEQREFSVVSLMGDTLSRFLFLQENEGFELDLVSKLPSGDALVFADPNRIEQVLYNFINNAAAHSRGERPDGSPISKSITLSVKPSDKDHVMILVSDRGEGIAKEDLPYIWDRYYKPYRTAGGINRGTGLGLSIVKAILTEHRVRYGVISEQNVGSTFWFELPITQKQS